MHDSRDVIRWILQSAGRRFPYAPKDSPWLPSVVSLVVDYIAGPHSLHVSGLANGAGGPAIRKRS
jgi:hypothetical protein